ncbi:uncharacterized protein LOC142350850 [Convolutriloba macropyga]|uniref:uncharacterized protein LOC142350850 n=1 Tax=Convolutriloba macropyga TaxID=536237 RepID=UPI003F522FBE
MKTGEILRAFQVAAFFILWTGAEGKNVGSSHSKRLDMNQKLPDTGGHNSIKNCVDKEAEFIIQNKLNVNMTESRETFCASETGQNYCALYCKGTNVNYGITKSESASDHQEPGSDNPKSKHDRRPINLFMILFLILVFIILTQAAFTLFMQVAVL